MAKLFYRTGGLLILIAIFQNRGLSQSEPMKADTASSTPKVIETVDWARPTVASKNKEVGMQCGEIIPGDEFGPARLRLKISGDTKCVAKFDHPKITQNDYAVHGQIRYQHVSPAGYIEMLHHSKDGTIFFSRTLDQRGPMGKLEGDSELRTFILPMHLDGFPPPKLVEVNVVGPGAGDVEIVKLELLDGHRNVYLAANQPYNHPISLSRPKAWWSDQMGGYIGGVFGTIFGIGGGLVGWQARRGRSRSLVINCLITAVVIGVLSLIAGIVAIILRQPYGVWYPLTLIGVLVPALSLGGLVRFSRIYVQQELQRMNALDS